VVANLSGSAQQVEIDLGIRGRRPIGWVEASEFARFRRPPTRSRSPLRLLLVLTRAPAHRHASRPGRAGRPARTRPVLTVEPGQAVLPGWLRRSSAFSSGISGGSDGSAQGPQGQALPGADFLPVEDAHLLLVRMSYEYGEDQVYVVSLTIASGEEASRISREHPNAVIARSSPRRTEALGHSSTRRSPARTFCRTL